MNEWLNNPLVKRVAEMKERFAPILNNPTYNLMQYLNDTSFSHIVEVQKHILPHLRNQQYFEQLAEIVQQGNELATEIDKKIEVVEDTVEGYGGYVERKTGIDIRAIIRQYIIDVYGNEDANDLRYRSKEEIVSDMITYARQETVRFDDLFSPLDVTANAELTLSDNQQPVTQERKRDKITQKTIALYYMYIHQSGSGPDFEQHPKGKIYACEEIAQLYGISAKNFQQTYNRLYKVSERLKQSNLSAYAQAIAMLEDYPKAQERAQKDYKAIQKQAKSR